MGVGGPGFSDFGHRAAPCWSHARDDLRGWARIQIAFNLDKDGSKPQGAHNGKVRGDSASASGQFAAPQASAEYMAQRFGIPPKTPLDECRSGETWLSPCENGDFRPSTFPIRNTKARDT